jgi:hypothetical protein
MGGVREITVRSLAVLAALAALTASGWSQPCVIASGVGALDKTCIAVGPGRLTFEPAIAEELIQKLPRGKSLFILSVGPEDDQAVATQYQEFLENRGFRIFNRTQTEQLASPPNHQITIQDARGHVAVTIAPGAR